MSKSPTQRQSLSSLVLRATLLLLVSAPFVLLLLAVQREPLQLSQTDLSAAELNRVEEILLESAPVSTTVATQTSIVLSEADLNLLLRYVLQLGIKRQELAAIAKFSPDDLMVEFSLPLPMSLYLNARAGFAINQQQVSINSLRIGNLQLPTNVLQFAEARLRGALASPSATTQELAALINNVDSIQIDGERLAVDLLWDPELIARLSDRTQQLLMTETERNQIVTYYELIATIINSTPLEVRALSLNGLLSPLMQLAEERSKAGDPVAENRALFLALAAYVNNEDIGKIVGPDANVTLTPARFIEIRLRRRQDLAQHVTSMAALTIQTGESVAATLSTTKEAYDARYRTGFSFSDLAANSVGTRLAAIAIRSDESARALQRRLASLSSEDEYMLNIGNNQDGLSETQFAEQFEDRMNDAYRDFLNDIELSIDQLPVFRDLAEY